MTTFTIGEEVLHEGLRYVITLRQAKEPYRYRLVRTTSEGPEVHWAKSGELDKIDRYTRPRADTPS